MKRRGSFDRSDYNFTSVLQDAAHFLMDEGAGDRPLSFQEIARAVRNGRNTIEGDFLRAAYQVEGHEDHDRGAEILTAEALKILERSNLVIEGSDGWKWNTEKANGRTSFMSQGSKIPLVSKEVRAEQDERARLEAPFIMDEPQLPARHFDPDTPENQALIASLRTVGFDDDFPILVDSEGVIVSGYNRAAACELVGIDWRDHTRTVKFKHSGPTRNIERTGKAVRANIHTPLSIATRKALSKKLKLEGHTTAEIAEAFGVSLSTAEKDTKGVVAVTVTATMATTTPSEPELVSLCMEEIQANPNRGQNFIFAKIRERGFAFDEKKARAAHTKAKSRLTTKAPEPVPIPPEPERIERRIHRVLDQILVDGKITHEELVEEWIDETG